MACKTEQLLVQSYFIFAGNGYAWKVKRRFCEENQSIPTYVTKTYISLFKKNYRHVMLVKGLEEIHGKVKWSWQLQSTCVPRKVEKGAEFPTSAAGLKEG